MTTPTQPPVSRATATSQLVKFNSFPQELVDEIVDLVALSKDETSHQRKAGHRLGPSLLNLLRVSRAFRTRVKHHLFRSIVLNTSTLTGDYLGCTASLAGRIRRLTPLFSTDPTLPSFVRSFMLTIRPHRDDIYERTVEILAQMMKALAGPCSNLRMVLIVAVTPADTNLSSITFREGCDALFRAPKLEKFGAWKVPALTSWNLPLSNVKEFHICLTGLSFRHTRRSTGLDALTQGTLGLAAHELLPKLKALSTDTNTICDLLFQDERRRRVEIPPLERATIHLNPKLQHALKVVSEALKNSYESLEDLELVFSDEHPSEYHRTPAEVNALNASTTPFTIAPFKKLKCVIFLCSDMVGDPDRSYSLRNMLRTISYILQVDSGSPCPLSTILVSLKWKKGGCGDIEGLVCNELKLDQKLVDNIPTFEGCRCDRVPEPNDKVTSFDRFSVVKGCDCVWGSSNGQSGKLNVYIDIASYWAFKTTIDDARWSHAHINFERSAMMFAKATMSLKTPFEICFWRSGRSELETEFLEERITFEAMRALGMGVEMMELRRLLMTDRNRRVKGYRR